MCLRSDVWIHRCAETKLPEWATDHSMVLKHLLIKVSDAHTRRLQHFKCLMALPRFSNKDFLFFWRKLERWVSIKSEYENLNHLIRSSSAPLNSAFIKFLSLDCSCTHSDKILWTYMLCTDGLTVLKHKVGRVRSVCEGFNDYTSDCSSTLMWFWLMP